MRPMLDGGRIGRRLALVVLLWGRLPAQTTRPEKAAEPKGQIGGVVSSAQTGEALKGALVSLRANRKQPNDDTPQLSGVTGADGKFLFPALPAGIYDLDVSKSGYHSRSDSSRRITVQEGQSVLELTTRLSRPGVIAGRVLDTNGDPLPGLRVQVWRRRFRNGRAGLEPGGAATSDDHGEYRVFDLPAGKYIVGVSAAGAAGNSSVLTMEYADVFHPNASQPSDATVLRLGWGQEASGVDFRVPAAPASMVAGVVYDGSSGGACPRCLVQFVRVSPSLLMAADRGLMTARDGTFLVRGLVPGSYRFTSAPLDPRAGSAAQEVQVTAGSGQQITMGVRRGEPVAGTVTFSKPLPDPGPNQQPVRISVRLVPEGAFRLVERGEVSKEDGTFRIEGVTAGNYRVEMEGLPPGGYLQSISVAGQEPAEPRLAVGETPPAEFKLKVSFEGARLTGLVRPSSSADGSGPPPNGVVVLLPPDEDGRYQAEIYGTYTPEGNFDLNGIPPGSYTAVAAPSRDSFECSDPEVRRALRKLGKEVKLTASGSSSIELILVREPDQPL